jgi:hypothetical protein
LPLLLAPTNTVFSGDNPTLVDLSFRKLAISTNSMRMVSPSNLNLAEQNTVVIKHLPSFRQKICFEFPNECPATHRPQAAADLVPA